MQATSFKRTQAVLRALSLWLVLSTLVQVLNRHFGTREVAAAAARHFFEQCIPEEGRSMLAFSWPGTNREHVVLLVTGARRVACSTPVARTIRDQVASF